MANISLTRQVLHWLLAWPSSPPPLPSRLVVPAPFAYTLTDGTPLHLRPLVPADAEPLRSGVWKLSETSRYQRFFTTQPPINPGMLRYLTEVDGYDHVAWGAQHQGEGVGVGRFIRLRDRPEAAEMALTVLDAYQGRGVGRVLLAVLYALAPQADVHLLEGDALAQNLRLLRWMQRLGARVEPVEGEGALLRVVLPVRAEPPDDAFGRLLATVRTRLFPAS